MAKRKVFMRTTIGALVLLVSAIVILSMAPKAPGQYEIGGAYIDIDPYAPGTELQVTLTIHYVYIPPTIPNPRHYKPCKQKKHQKIIVIPPEYSDYGFAAGPFFIRIVKGGEKYAYSGNFSADPATNTPDTLSEALCTGDFCRVIFVSWDDVDTQEYVLDELLKTRIIPELFPDNPSATYAIKSQSLEVMGGDEVFAMFDLVLAVNDSPSP
jgi:hypothetical protein